MSLTLKYDFSGDASLAGSPGPTLALTRTTTASVTDYNNIIKEVASGEERYTGGRRVENVIQTSEDLTASNFAVVGNAEVIVNQATDPLTGNATADKLQSDTTGSSARYSTWNNLDNYPIADYTVSCVAKADGHNFIQLTTASSQFDGNPYTNFDLSDGTVGNSSGAVATGIIDLGSGWYRCWHTITMTSVGINRQPWTTTLAASKTAARLSAATITDGDGVLINGLQIELVSGQDDPSPSEYQATTTAAVSKWYATKRRTNLLLQSNALNVTWVNVRSTDSQSAGTDPDGGATANSLNEDATEANDHFIYQTFVASDNTTYTFSVYLKASNRTWARVLIRTQLGGEREADFNLAAGTVGTVDAAATAAISDAGGGWYRCAVTADVGAAGASEQVRIYAGEGDTDVTFDGLGQESILVYGAQLERA